MSSEFRNSFARDIFYHKYAQGANDTWRNLAIRLVDDVCGSQDGKLHPILSLDEREYLVEAITNFKFIPGGRYLYYAGRKAHFFSNCYLLRAESDTREEWADLTSRATSALMSGGGIGVDYSRLRESGRVLSRTGGRASGPIPLMYAINEIGRNVMQGGSRRSAIYASLNWRHHDILGTEDDTVPGFLRVKNWHNQAIKGAVGLEALVDAEIKDRFDYAPFTVWDAKQSDFNYNAPLDMTNISVNYDNAWLAEVFGCDEDPDGFINANLSGDVKHLPDIFLENCRQAMMTGEPGFSFNFGDKENETLRNACCEVTSEDDSDVCNLGSINVGAVETMDEFRDLVGVASKFLVCGTVRADLPYEKVYQVREKNRRLGLGLMGIHEWLLKRGEKYEVTPELHKWLEVYRDESKKAADDHCERLYLSKPAAYRAIAPTGSIGILAGTTTGIEPLLAVAYKRRYLKDKTRWHYQYVIDATAESLIKETGVDPSTIDTAIGMEDNYEQRIKFQADIQDYVDMSISSTINLPAWGTRHNNEDKVREFAEILARYAPRLRGFTCYPDGSRGGQPLTQVDYEQALNHKGVEFQEHDLCSITGKGGTCGA